MVERSPEQFLLYDPVLEWVTLNGLEDEPLGHLVLRLALEIDELDAVAVLPALSKELRSALTEGAPSAGATPLDELLASLSQPK